MATIKNIERWNVVVERPKNKQPSNYIWLVECGEKYDLVKLSLNEMTKGYYWADSIAVPKTMSDEDVRKAAEKIAEGITQDAINSYEKFLEELDTYGCD